MKTNASDKPATRKGLCVQRLVRPYEPYDFVYALEQAAEFLENEEWPDPETKAAQEAANKEAAKRIRAMADRYAAKHIVPNTEASRGA